MEQENPGFVARLIMAFVLPWRVLFDASFARAVSKVGNGDALSSSTVVPPAQLSLSSVVAPVVVAAPKVDAVDVGAHEEAGALHLLAILQREGRLVDFLLEDIASYSDAEVGAAVRVVHEGGRKVLKDHVTLAPVRDEAEEASVTIVEGFDPMAVRLTGRVGGAPPYSGRLTHRGWRVVEGKFPRRQTNAAITVIQPAEVEIA